MAFVLRVLENLDFAPGTVAVSVGDCTLDQVGADVDFTLDADPTVLYADQVDDNGVLRATVPIPSGVAAGDHTLTATIGPDSDSATLTVLHDAADSTDAPDDYDFLPPDIPTPFARWTFIDVDPDSSETWTMPHNPTEWDGPPERPLFYAFDAACGPKGQILSWQNSGRPWPMSFKGVTFTQQEYRDLHRWSQKRRRFWLYDHRHMLWVLTFTQFDAQPRVHGNVNGYFDPWLHDYTMTCLVFNKPGGNPFVIEDDVAV